MRAAAALGHLPDTADSDQRARRRTAAAPLPWVERVALAYLCHGPRAVGFVELCRDEQLAVVRMASELAGAGSPGRPVAGRWWAA
jgi:hypothetical protein